MIGLLLIIVGLLLWLLAGWFVAGIILIVVGVVLLFVPGVPYGYDTWRGRRGPPGVESQRASWGKNKKRN